MKLLGPEFFNRKTVTVAQELLGKYVVREIGTKKVALKITEVEAYDGPHDLASHASKGKTKRTDVMFGHPGTLYIYLVYGMHWMLNVVTGPKDYPAAVLVRGVEGISGPGRVTKNLAITGVLHGSPAYRNTGLWFEDHGEKISKKHIIKTARIGVTYAGPIWAAKEYRFLLSTPPEKVL